jgi:hypothetical protein
MVNTHHIGAEAMPNWHTQKMAEVKRRTMAELYYSRKDLREVIAIQEQSARAGLHVPKLGQYIDELHYVAMEIRRRQEER